MDIKLGFTLASSLLISEGCADDLDYPAECKPLTRTLFRDATRPVVYDHIFQGDQIRLNVRAGVNVNDQQVAAVANWSKEALMNWIDRMRGASTKPLIEWQGLVFSDQDPHITVNVYGYKSRACAWFSDVEIYLGDGPGIVAHEFGHVVGLDDTYDRSTLKCVEGYPASLMCNSREFGDYEDKAAKDAFCQAHSEACSEEWKSRDCPLF